MLKYKGYLYKYSPLYKVSFYLCSRIAMTFYFVCKNNRNFLYFQIKAKLFANQRMFQSHKGVAIG